MRSLIILNIFILALSASSLFADGMPSPDEVTLEVIQNNQGFNLNGRQEMPSGPGIAAPRVNKFERNTVENQPDSDDNNTPTVVETISANESNVPDVVKNPRPGRTADKSSRNDFPKNVRREPKPEKREKHEREKPKHERPKFERPKFEKPKHEKPKFERPKFEKPKFERQFERPKFEKPKFERPKFEKPKFERPKFEKPKFERPKVERPKFERPKKPCPRRR